MDIMRVNRPPSPNERSGMGKNIIHRLSGLNPHHFIIYPMMEIPVDMINAVLLPHVFDIQVMIGIIKNAVAMALIVENQAGQLPAFSKLPLKR
jgi:hypothetical protein